MEKWRDIKGYEGLYQVSNYGRVKSLERDVELVSKLGKLYIRRQKEKIRAPHWNNNGYIVYDLWKNNEMISLLIHHLVAEAFIPNPMNFDTVHHKDHNPANNCVDNLEWMDGGEHSAIHTNERAKRVDQIDKVTGEILHQWNSATEAARELGYDNGNISKCCSDKYPSYKTYKNYIWRHC